MAANNLATIMRQARQRVGLDQRDGRRGLNLMRHTLASRMLASGSPLKRIGDVMSKARPYPADFAGGQDREFGRSSYFPGLLLFPVQVV